MKTRIAFTFDEQSFNVLTTLKEKGRYETLGKTVSNSIRILKTFHNQAEQGYSEVVLRNPKTNQERVLIIPSLQ